LAGGIWSAENKVLPGVYINVKSQPTVTANIGQRGVVAIAKALSWGDPGKVVEITPGQDVMAIVGYSISDDKARFLREMMRGTDLTAGPYRILLYRYTGTGGVKAKATQSMSGGATVTITAKYTGVRGNDISVTCTLDPDTNKADVVTYVEGAVVDSQTISAFTELTTNDWVEFTISGGLADFTVTLSGGVDPTVATADDAAFLTAIEPYTFDILAYDGNSDTSLEAYSLFIKRMNESIGKKCQLVVGNFTGLNSKYIISARNGVVLGDGTALSDKEVVWWLAGAEAGALYYQSLTYAQYPTATAANPKLSDADVETAIGAGQIAFIDDWNIVRICTDINSKTTVTPSEGAEFKKNRVMRVIMQFCNDCYRNFAENFIGKVDNNLEGRSLLRAWVIGYLNDMMANGGIQNFTADDVEVLPGAAIDAVIINVTIMPTDSVEKVYVSVTVDANISVVTE
jgi:hypothetical protein